MFKSTGRAEKIWFSTLQQPIRIIFKINKKETHNLIFQSTPTKSKLPQNSTTLIHSSILTNTLCATIQETNFENKSPSNSMPHTQTSSTKKKKKLPSTKTWRDWTRNKIQYGRAEKNEREREPVFRRVVLSGLGRMGSHQFYLTLSNIYGLPRVQTIKHHDYFEQTGPFLRPISIFRIFI